MPRAIAKCLLSGCAVLLLAACASNQKQVKSAVVQADLNADAKVTCAEWNTWLNTNYPRYDADQSGALSEREYNQFISSTKLFGRVPLSNIDADGDRQFTLPEVATFSERAFKSFDEDGDCALAGDELLITVEGPKPKAPIKSPPAANAPRSGSSNY